MNSALMTFLMLSAAAGAGMLAGIIVYRLILRVRLRMAAPRPVVTRVSVPPRARVSAAWAELARDPRSAQSKKMLLAAGIVCFVMGFALTGKIIFAVMCAVAPLVGVRFMHARAAALAAGATNAQLAEALGMLANNLRAGQSLQQALESLAAESAQPLSLQWAQLISEVRLGMPMDEALEGVGRRVQTPEMSMAITAMRLARETGGNLADILTRVAAIIGERRKVEGKIKALTAQGRASGVIMSFIPFVLLVVMYALEPSLAGLLFTTVLGNLMLVAVVAMLVTGAFVINKIVDISI